MGFCTDNVPYLPGGEYVKGVADRVCLGLLPSSEGSWKVAVTALRSVCSLSDCCKKKNGYLLQIKLRKHVSMSFQGHI